MSTQADNTTATAAADHSDHPPFLAHHYDTPAQQAESGKLGMWVFLATEILMFGGLFCAYSVYRANHPDVFVYAHQYLDKWLGGINTLVLIASSFTMAWAVRCAQINKRKGLIVCLVLTLLGGVTFMGIKSIEYHAKWKHHLFVGSTNKYRADHKPAGAIQIPESVQPSPATKPTTGPAPAPGMAMNVDLVDPNAGTSDEAKIKAPAIGPQGLATESQAAGHHLSYEELQKQDRARVYTFFGVYFVMTGLHGLHVLIGMGIITWLLVRSVRGNFSSRYFTPVDLGGLYWHLVDLIWIFLFPLLYLIH